MSFIHDQARTAAARVGILLIRFQEGFYVFDATNGNQLGDPDALHEPWNAVDVIGFCGSLEEGDRTGVYTTEGF